MPLPNFIIFGAVKGGTSSLYHYCKQHPDIYMSPLKEARFFAYDETDPEFQGKAKNRFPIRRMDEYRALFEGVSGQTVIGEASPQYLRSQIAAVRIKQVIPHVKLLASLRHPVDRIYSGYTMSVRAGSENRSIEDVFRDRRLLDSSCYYESVKRYFELFGRDQIKIIIFEDFTDRTLYLMQEIFTFLGVDEGFVPDVTEKYNSGRIPRNKILEQVIHRTKSLRRVMAPVEPFLPKRLRNVCTKLRNMNLARPPALPSDTRAELSGYFRDDILRLQDLLRRDLSVWLTEPPRKL